MPEYTLAAIVAPILVIAAELLWLRTGLLRQGRYWATVAIALGFQVPVDGWLTNRPNPAVVYSDAHTSGIRLIFDIPIEDFGFGYALITFTLLLWRRQQLRRSPQARHA